MNREQCIKNIKAERGKIQGKALKALVTDALSKPFGNRYLRTDKMIGKKLTLQNLTTETLRAVVRYMRDENVRM